MSANNLVFARYREWKEGSKRTPCSMYGCKRVYTDTSALEIHIKDHEIPAESLPGKVFLCSTTGCNGSFPNMQRLMEHMRHHYKPNIYFLCESCRTKLRSYRGLLTHLHTCSKVPRSRAKMTEATPAQPAAVTAPVLSTAITEQNVPEQQSESTAQQLPTQMQKPEGSLPASVAQQNFTCAPLSSASLSNQDTSTQHLREIFLLPQLKNEASVPPSLKAQSVLTELPDVHSQSHPQTRSPEMVLPAPPSTLHSPSMSTAVWKKNQGVSCSVRILWEHTRGRYRCVQCGTQQVTAEISRNNLNTQHGGSKPAEDTGKPRC
ncbi:LOW QUALITY PROTEIN: zinc finger protein 414 [Thalassophryne amazonica]|uniref:LOW QUALITY PROTEIN: zinc finger protein 414 n=1 Tax=Thalassophryne amazonica TaxID=390379 RepID=UPI001470FDAA|nr:LOW QUALITY PROTEIN: zinc finger protein 414 [Thalassophryne amazonica]